MPAKLRDTHKLVCDIGTGYYVEKVCVCTQHLFLLSSGTLCINVSAFKGWSHLLIAYTSFNRDLIWRCTHMSVHYMEAVLHMYTDVHRF